MNKEFYLKVAECGGFDALTQVMAKRTGANADLLRLDLVRSYVVILAEALVVEAGDEIRPEVEDLAIARKEIVKILDKLSREMQRLQRIEDALNEYLHGEEVRYAQAA